jgi:hypothetical protein
MSVPRPHRDSHRTDGDSHRADGGSPTWTVAPTAWTGGSHSARRDGFRGMKGTGRG